MSHLVKAYAKRICQCLVILTAVLPAWPVKAGDSATVESETITNLHELTLAVETRRQFVGSLDLEAVVCAADTGNGKLALQDNSDVVVCESELFQRPFFPGERVHFKVPLCELVRRKWSVAIIVAPVVNNGGIHGATEVTGQVQLTAGLQPIRLFYFNAREPSELVVQYSGPGRPKQPIPASALFRESTNATAGSNQLTQGLDYACYDDMPATINDLQNAQPINSGLATNFDISRRNPKEFVAMQFRGMIEIPSSGTYTFSTLSDDGSELYVGRLQADMNVLASNAPPVAHRLHVREPTAVGETSVWTTLTGRVSFVGEDSNGVNLELQDGNSIFHVGLASLEDIAPPLLQNAEVQATGVCRSINGPDGQNHFGQIAVVNSSNLRILNLAEEQWKKHRLTSIASLPEARPDTGRFIAHLSGTISHLAADGTFTLTDGTGAIQVRALARNGLANGLTVEVLGSGLRYSSSQELRGAFCRKFKPSPELLPTLTTAAQVQQLSASEAARHYPVRVQGVITCLVEWSGAVVQDATRGVFFSFQASYHDGLVPGDYAEIRGVTAVGDFAPVISAESIQVLDHGQFPEAAQPSWKQLISGSLDSQYAEVRGIITGVAGNEVTLLTESGKIKVLMHNMGEATLKHYLNTLVRIRGCLLALWDADTHQVKVGEIVFRNPLIEVDQLPMAEPFSAPVKTISDLLLFDLQASSFQRVKVSGQIVYAHNSQFFLMQGGRGLRFQPVGDNTNLQAGDLVEVVGIPDLNGSSPQLHEAVARQTGIAPLPAAQVWPDANNPEQNRDAIRMQVDARLIDLHHTGLEWVLELQTGLRACRALVSTPDNLAGIFPLGSRLQVTGVYASLNGEHDDALAAFELLLNSSKDIQLLARPSWWNLRRLLYIVAALIGGLAAAALWIKQLHRQVALRTILLEREHAQRERAERERAVEFERSRIARDLHDDLGSSLSEIRVLASSGQRLREAEAEAKAPSLFQAITEKARSLIGALDVIVWAVDPEDNSLQSVADYLSGFAAEYLANADIVCRFKIPVSLPSATLEGRTRHELFLAVKEVLHNIVQHSHAQEVEFRLTATAVAVDIEIIDNGCGFEVDSWKADGHGLKNISERVTGLGGTCRTTSHSGTGTKVSIHLPLLDRSGG
jgi:signal transduction histidine kinase